MRRRQRNSTGNSLLSWPVIGGAVVIASLLLMALLALLLTTRQPRAAVGQVTAVLTMIPANTPASGNPLTGGATPLPGEETPVPTPPPGVLAIGAHVQIVGTGGDGLRMRDQPGLAGEVLMLGSEAEVFKVEDGPRELDGYTWWYLVGPFDANRRGWAVVNYLEVVQNP